MRAPSHAISVIQPWAWLLTRPDIVGAKARALAREIGAIKDVENRDWYSSTRGWVLLHASATKLSKWDWQSAALFALRCGVEVPHRDAIALGAFVGAIRIDACEAFVRSRWFVGKHGFVVGDSVAFARPVPAKGALKFFPVTPSEALECEWEKAMENHGGF